MAKRSGGLPQTPSERLTRSGLAIQNARILFASAEPLAANHIYGDHPPQSDHLMAYHLTERVGAPSGGCTLGLQGAVHIWGDKSRAGA